MSEDWQDQAACRDLPAWKINQWFFPDRGAPVGHAKAICADCPVREECLEYALSNNEKHGVWGGTSERERRRIRRTRVIMRTDRCRACEKRFTWVMRGGQQPIFCSDECSRTARAVSVASTRPKVKARASA